MHLIVHVNNTDYYIKLLGRIAPSMPHISPGSKSGRTGRIGIVYSAPFYDDTIINELHYVAMTVA